MTGAAVERFIEDLRLTVSTKPQVPTGGDPAVQPQAETLITPPARNIQAEDTRGAAKRRAAGQRGV